MSPSPRHLGLALALLTAGCEAILGIEPTHEWSAPAGGASGAGGATALDGDGGKVSASSGGNGAGGVSGSGAATTGTSGSLGVGHGGTGVGSAGGPSGGSAGRGSSSSGNAQGGANAGASGSSEVAGEAGDSASGAAGLGGEAGDGGTGGGGDPLDGTIVGPGQRCLTVGDVTAEGESHPVTVGNCAGQDRQRFRRTASGGLKLDDGSGLALTVESDGGVWEGASLRAAPEDPVGLEQRWAFDFAELVEVTSGLCVNVPNAYYYDGQQLDLDVCGPYGQYWLIDTTGVVTYYGWCIDIPNGIPYPKNKVQTWECNNGSNQRFDLLHGRIGFAGLCAVAGDDGTPGLGAKLALALCDATALPKPGEPRYVMRGVLTNMGLCLQETPDDAGGDKLSLETCTYRPEQTWSYYF